MNPPSQVKAMAGPGKIGGMGLNLGNLEDLKKDQGDFHDEFMARIDEYSESWREAARREKRF